MRVWISNSSSSRLVEEESLVVGCFASGMTELKKKEKRKGLAKWVKEGLLRLGPTFIKIGQQFSTRVDILAQEYVDELAELQDQVPPFESETVVRIIETERGQPVDVIFDRFDRDPIAAANLVRGRDWRD
ncbi:unnamed protein product [Sphagnum compactum]